jgi:hypothetical protein
MMAMVVEEVEAVDRAADGKEAVPLCLPSWLRLTKEMLSAQKTSCC